MTWHPSMSAQPDQDVLADVHHHSFARPVVGQPTSTMCGTVRTARRPTDAEPLPCCPMCHEVMVAHEFSCPPKEARP